MERSTKKGPRALRAVARNDRRAIERAVKEMFAEQGQLVLPILSLVTEARVHIEDALGEVSRGVLEALLGHKSASVTTDYSAAEIEHLIAQANKVTVGDQRSSPTLTVLRRRAA
jgi:hypothetical protein